LPSPGYKYEAVVSQYDIHQMASSPLFDYNQIVVIVADKRVNTYININVIKSILPTFCGSKIFL